MYYMQGDYYRGDYYRGDPGIFSFLGRVVKTVGKIGIGAASGFITGGGIKGAIVGAAGGAAVATRENIAEETLGAGDTGTAYTPAMRARHAEVVARGGAGLITRGGLARQAANAPALGMTVTGHRRLHWNKTTYITRGGGTSRWPVGIQVHPKGTEPVPSRRMNVANPRALRRAIHRMSGFGKLVRHMKRAIARASTAVGNVHRGRKSAPRRR